MDGPIDFRCVWCSVRFENIDVRNVHEDLCSKKAVPRLVAKNIVCVKFDKSIEHLLTLIESTKDAESVFVYAESIEKLVQSKDIYTQEEK